MVFRLLFGLMKGLVIGGLVGYGLAAAGMGTPGAIVAYASAALVAALIAVVAGKKIWEADGRIQVLLKAVAGLLLGPGLMWVLRSFVTMPLPFDVSQLPGLESLQGTSPAIGALSITSLALVAAILGGFYDADNSPQAGKGKPPAPKAGKRVDPEMAALTGLDPAEIEALEAEAEERKAKK